jgi:hypothetical protein
VVPGSSNEIHQQSSDDTHNITLVEEEEGPVDITYPSSKPKPEVSCIVFMFPQTHFINIMGVYCHNGVHLCVPHKTSLSGEWKLSLLKLPSKDVGP